MTYEDARKKTVNKQRIKEFKMKNNETVWQKTASGWNLKRAFSESPSMTELSTPSFEETGLHSPSSGSAESSIEHEDWIKGLVHELKGIIGEDPDSASRNPRANEIVGILSENGIDPEKIISIMSSSET